MNVYNPTDAHRVHSEWQWPLSGVHFIMMEKSAQPGVGGGGGCTPTNFHSIYHYVQSFNVRSRGMGEEPILLIWHLELRVVLHIANEGPVRIQYKCLVTICVFPEWKPLFTKQNYNVLSFNSYTHVSVRDLYISRIACLFCCSHICGPPILGIYINRSQTHECGNWDRGAVPRKQIHKWDFRCSARLT
jgi:hypothetical protein